MIPAAIGLLSAKPRPNVVIEGIVRADEEEADGGKQAECKDPGEADLSLVGYVKVTGKPDDEEDGPDHDAAESHHPEKHATEVMADDDEHTGGDGYHAGPEVVCDGRRASCVR